MFCPTSSLIAGPVPASSAWSSAAAAFATPEATPDSSAEPTGAELPVASSAYACCAKASAFVCRARCRSLPTCMHKITVFQVTFVVETFVGEEIEEQAYNIMCNSSSGNLESTQQLLRNVTFPLEIYDRPCMCHEYYSIEQHAALVNLKIYVLIRKHPCFTMTHCTQDWEKLQVTA